MTFFFLVVGLEAKRELDLGELRERRRIAIPVLAALGGMARADRDLPRLQRRRRRRARLGRGDVHRHRVRARRAGAAHAARGHAHARLPADAGGGRRPLRAAGDRDRLHQPRLGRRARGRGRAVRRAAALRYAPAWRAPGVDRGRGRPVGGDVRVGHRPGHLAGSPSGSPPAPTRPSREDLERATALARSFREQPTPELARSAQQGVLVGDLAQRAPAVQPAPLDQLRGRAAVRARQRRRAHHRRPARTTRSARRSPSASSSATWSASRSGIARRLVARLAARAARAALAAQRPAARGRRARSPGSASPSRC